MPSRRAWILGTAAALAIATAVLLWAGLQWPANFDSDEAIWGLMARHTLQGNPPTYRYGLAYLGSLESLLAAAVMKVLGTGVVPLRLASLPLYLAFLLVHSLLVRRHWGAAVAVFSTLLLALPARWILEWVYRPMGFGTILPFGTAALLLAGLTPTRRRLHLLRLAALGLLAGLALWSNPSTMLYFAALGVVVWLGSEEWQRVHAAVMRLLRVGRASVGSVVMPLAVVAAALLALVAVFADGCDPTWTAAARVAKAVLAVAALGLLAATLAVSRRRLALLGFAGVAGLGIAAGNLPMWRAWLFYGVAPARAIMPSCPADVPDRAELVFDRILPALSGAFRASYLPQAVPWQAALWFVVIGLAAAAAVAILERERLTVAGLAQAAPLSAAQRPAAIVLLLLALPVLLATMGSNTMDVTSTRYVMISWQAGTVILALALTRLGRRWRGVAALLVAAWALQVVLVSYRDVGRAWQHDQAKFAPEPVAALEDYLHLRGVGGAYGGYWLSYALDYLWDERIPVAPFSGDDRYPAYTRQVGALPLQAYVFWPGDVAAEGADAAALAAALVQGDAGGPGHPDLAERMRGQQVIERRRVGNWDVWLVADRGARSHY